MPENNKVSWTVFAWVVGIFTILLIAMFSMVQGLASKVEAGQRDNGDIKIQLSRIQTDILWIREKLNSK